MKFITAKNNKGFTLLELIIVMAIIGILAATVLLNPGILDNRNKAIDTSNLDLATKIQQQLYTYVLTTGNTIPNDVLGLVGDNQLTKLIENGIVSPETQIPAGVFFIASSTEKTPLVGFNLQSTQYQKTSKCYEGNTFTSVSGTCTGSSRYFVPFSGRLGSGSGQTTNSN